MDNPKTSQIVFEHNDQVNMDAYSPVTMMDLPIEMIDKILSYLSFDQITKLRGVSRTFNNICSDKLNKGFTQVEQFHRKCLREVKSRLPRRESERKNHPLARHNDILMSVETRLSMLSMTYMKYIDACHCCFIPGKVLDEAFKALRIVNQNIMSTSNTSPSLSYLPALPRPHYFLQEYRDISSMAMEHFDDKILPSIKEKMRLEKPQMYCFKSRTESGGERAVTKAVKPLVKLFRVLHQTRAKCNSNHITLQQNIKSISHKFKCQNTLLKQKLNAQKNIIKHMKRELRDTRNAMNVLSKEVNRLKFEQTTPRDSSSNERSSGGKNLSLSLPSTLCIPAAEKKDSTEMRGLKKKRDISEESTSKDDFCKRLCNT
uniref:F-box domain-containing protein n=1 Tax=Graphocephala atropunctata TaxID=36148 RepID=A0A1B6MUQ9_9HEMI